MTPSSVFIVGAPRSGTTYLQQLIGAHPLVATSQETDLFLAYVAPWREQWRQQLPDDAQRWARCRHKGLPAVLTEAMFDSLVSPVIHGVYTATLALKPTAQLVLDKVPRNGRVAETILHYLPDARFVHLVRDGRDVVASLLRAADGWGHDWAPGSARAAAAHWRVDIEACRSIARMTGAYHEVRYEQLVSESGAHVLREVLDFCGVDAPRDFCVTTISAFELGSGLEAKSSLLWGGEVIRRLGSPPEEPAGFAGEGGIGSWARDLDLRKRAIVHQEAGDLLRLLGYADSSVWVGSPWQLRAMTGLGFLKRISWRARHRLAHLISA
jgi:hypothetical protein